MSDLIVFSVNSTFDKIDCSDSIAEELYDHFSFDVPGAFYMRRKNPRLKYWDGRVHLFSKKGHQIYSGLRSKIEDFCREQNYSISYNTHWLEEEFSLHEASEFIKTLNLPSHIIPKDYQVATFVKSVRRKRLTNLSPTASGKSLIIYFLCCYFDVKTLIIVPNVNLVNQMISHFGEYGYKGEIHPIYSGQDKVSDKNFIVSTWQSLYKESPEFFNQFKMIITDEVHTAQAECLKGIMEKSTEVDLRFGFTGTLDDSLTNQLVIEGLFGEVNKVISTSDLMKRGDIAQLKIKALVLDYPEEVKKIFSKQKLDYSQELEWIVTNESRKKFINNLTLSLKGNTIILFRLVEKHGKVLYEDLKKLLPKDRPVYYISGEVEAETREEIRNLLAKETNAVLVGSYGCVSQGLDAPSLKHLIFASPYKSKIKVLQSIGRTLRKYKDLSAILYDISDNLTYKSHQNFTIRHYIERISLYEREDFVYHQYQIKLKE